MRQHIALGLAVGLAALAAPGCGGGESCEDYARITCEKACGCAPEGSACYVGWGKLHEFQTQADCEETLRGICAAESDFDAGECVGMVEGTSCDGQRLTHPACPLSGGSEQPEGAPEVRAPERTPLEAVAFRGTAPGARRVAVVNALSREASVGPVLADGAFCLESALVPSTVTTFLVRGLDEAGSVSPAAELSVIHDPGAPVPEDATCESDACAEAEQCSGDEVDNDCNGYANECDPACNGCQDDAMEPNDIPFLVPPIAPGSHELKICPCRDDWFALSVGAGEAISISMTIGSVAIDLDLALYTREDAESGGRPVAVSRGTGYEESIEYTATETGDYYLQIFPSDREQLIAGSYTLVVN